MNPYSDGHVLRIRLFRIRHGITLRELSAQSGITVQRINCIERMEFSLTPRSRERILCALEAILHSRIQNTAIALRDFQYERARLFDVVMEKAEGGQDAAK